jgi:hypothetical protein
VVYTVYSSLKNSGTEETGVSVFRLDVAWVVLAVGDYYFLIGFDYGSLLLWQTL